MTSKHRPLVYLTRVEQFSSAHCLFNRSMDKQSNEALFGKCNNTHGHNYRLEVTVKGTADPSTGMIINIVDLKDIIDSEVLQILDHKNIDQDVGYFRLNSVISSSE